ncbi:MAG: hypothetical protein SGI86_08025, partial [Deltaproteobacteria bacterium]|nr:hypothetical protein [Deltaproteobacteria bacterium]
MDVASSTLVSRSKALEIPGLFFVRNGGCASTPLIQSAVNGLNDRKTILEEDEDTAWQNVSLINTKDSYSSYLLLFRKGKYRRKALVAIDSIQ